MDRRHRQHCAQIFFFSYVTPVSCDDWENSLTITEDGDRLENIHGNNNNKRLNEFFLSTGPSMVREKIIRPRGFFKSPSAHGFTPKNHAAVW